MELAIKIAEKGIGTVDSPFGACIIKGNDVLAVGHSTVLSNNNATRHAEMNAIAAASKKLKTFDLSGCTIYSTTEPCPMCFSAIHWARISKIVWGTNISDVKALGFSELTVSNKQMKKLGKSKVKITSDFMRNECLDLLKKWKKGKGKIY
ncbi:nucleoside deaminase [Candidatus Micrarchaeota archaeon]|nr:nucleoside deaminase [Candidatus Micrarchaeota archaeon]MBU1165883.1 nucleoside deaminase [Candidatus Micrarchaeota archaeon]MBU1886995.1 nucleoside deaminase [Candidatus Micrarchaeota archaeon]